MAQAKKTKKQRKHDRNKDTCKVYAVTHQRERNKLAHLTKHLQRCPNDAVALAAVARCKAVLGLLASWQSDYAADCNPAQGC